MREGIPPDTGTTTPKNIIDAWKQVIKYQSYPGALYAGAMGIPAAQANEYFSIWSPARNGIDESGAGDDISNWERVGRVQ